MSLVLKEGNPLGLHYVMFIPAIIGQGTVEQQSKWLKRAYNLEIVGTYAQVYFKNSVLRILFMVILTAITIYNRPNLVTGLFLED